jgi:hypothetical protein
MNRAYIFQSSLILYFFSAAGNTFQHGSSSVTLNDFAAMDASSRADFAFALSAVLVFCWLIEGRDELVPLYSCDGFALEGPGKDKEEGSSADLFGLTGLAAPPEEPLESIRANGGGWG